MATKKVRYKHPKTDQYNEQNRVRTTVPNAIGVASQWCEDENYVWIVYEIVIREQVSPHERGDDGFVNGPSHFGPLIRTRW